MTTEDTSKDILTLSGQVTENDFVQAQDLHLGQFKRGSNFALGFVGIFILCGLISLFLGGSSSGADDGSNRAILLGLLPVALIPPAIILGLRFFVFPNQAKRAYQQQDQLQLPFTFVLNERGIRMESNLSNTQHLWSHIKDRKENADLLVLYLASNVIMPLPKRMFTAAELATFNEMYAQYVVPQTVPLWRRILPALLVSRLVLIFIILQIWAGAAGN